MPHDDVQAGREHVCRHLSTKSPGNNATAVRIRNRAQCPFRPVPGGRPRGLRPPGPRVRTSSAGQGSAPAKVGNLPNCLQACWPAACLVAAVHCGAGQGSFLKL